MIHGPDHAQDHLARHFAQNLESVEQVARLWMLTPIPVSRDVDLDMATVTPDTFEGGPDRLRNHVETLHEEVAALNEELAAVRNTNDGLSEAEIRQIVRDEIQNVADESE